MKNIKLIIDFDGTNYSGFQAQDNAHTVEDALNAFISKALGEDIKVIGCSRTDKGVSAHGFVLNFKTESVCPAEKMIYPINDKLPEDIRVLKSEEVADDFHARFSSKGKYYRYTLEHRKFGRATNRHFAYNFPYKLDLDLMREAAKYMVGEKDYRAFMAIGSAVDTTVRTIHSVDIIRDGDFVYIDVKGRSFLYNMVRIMSGTLVFVGTGILDIDSMARAIEDGDRRGLAPTLPAKGLVLEEVYY